MIQNPFFHSLVASINQSSKIATVRTLNSRLWDKFNITLPKIRSEIAIAEFITLVLMSGRLLTINLFLDSWFMFWTNICASQLHASEIFVFLEDIARIMFVVSSTKLFRRAYLGVDQTFFVADSAPINKAAVGKYMG